MTHHKEMSLGQRLASEDRREVVRTHVANLEAENRRLREANDLLLAGHEANIKMLVELLNGPAI